MIQRYSKQRETILRYLQSVTCHPTAETVYSEVRKEIPNISLGTVYRNLNQLAEEGTILRLTANTGADYYDGRTTQHNHVLCTRCGKIEDIFEPIDTMLDAFAAEITKYTALSHSLHFYGICPQCQAEMESDCSRNH